METSSPLTFGKLKEKDKSRAKKGAIKKSWLTIILLALVLS